MYVYTKHVSTCNYIKGRSIQTFTSTSDFENKEAKVHKHILTIKKVADGCCKEQIILTFKMNMEKLREGI